MKRFSSCSSFQVNLIYWNSKTKTTFLILQIVYKPFIDVNMLILTKICKLQNIYNSLFINNK